MPGATSLPIEAMGPGPSAGQGQVEVGSGAGRGRRADSPAQKLSGVTSSSNRSCRMKPGIRANMTWAMYSGSVSGSTVPSACGRHRRSGRGAQVSGGLEQASPGGFDIRAVPDRVAAVKAIEDRDVYGAIVLDPQNAEVLTALGRWSRSRADPGATACTAGCAVLLGNPLSGLPARRRCSRAVGERPANCCRPERPVRRYVRWHSSTELERGDPCWCCPAGSSVDCCSAGSAHSMAGTGAAYRVVARRRPLPPDR
ncbi:MAG: hypothetical protein QOH50_35 [Kribbellaceae bacterium]|nr:hypothetical protein [Kribbellaceae bacterium]